MRVNLSIGPQNQVANNRSVTPAKAGVQNALKGLDSGFRRNDECGIFGYSFVWLRTKLMPMRSRRDFMDSRSLCRFAPSNGQRPGARLYTGSKFISQPGDDAGQERRSRSQTGDFDALLIAAHIEG
jgi:hypothetical protein